MEHGNMTGIIAIKADAITLVELNMIQCLDGVALENIGNQDYQKHEDIEVTVVMTIPLVIQIVHFIIAMNATDNFY
jgi:uncharacterized protein (DUF169 family)